ncbi:MAG: hypothetical protein KME07_18315 [Pegethrix bostrychoides GSE-TBD4-15B]|jgi:hypothetical protein|uniref:Uncharacterized protein n=1 Tax=Pegethrix bostrychoides GSE-TBD4-15B TaxID=2839662 RepID=A0A951U5Z6_9CYAN|nr:hypothetical protein [Pegethrix bostrychoides GSE-TBD4-15B]
MPQTKLAELYRPFLIVADFPGQLPRAIARTYNQEDAEDQIRFLKRQIVNGAFYIVYDPEPLRLRPD